MTLSLVHTHHIAIICTNLEKSLTFYCGTLGFKEVDRIERLERKSIVVYLQTQDILIELFTFPNPPKRLSYPEAVGLRHIAFATKDFDATIIKLAASGVTMVAPHIDPRSGKRGTFIFDPDELPIEIIEIE